METHPRSPERKHGRKVNQIQQQQKWKYVFNFFFFFVIITDKKSGPND